MAFDEQLVIRVDRATVDLIADLGRRSGTGPLRASPTTVARAALTLGLKQLAAMLDRLDRLESAPPAEAAQ